MIQAMSQFASRAQVNVELLDHMDRQADGANAVQPGLDPGRDGGLALVNHIDGQPVSREQRADVGRQLENDLVDIFGGMDAVGNRLQALEEGQTAGDITHTTLRNAAHAWISSGKMGPGSCGAGDLEQTPGRASRSLRQVLGSEGQFKPVVQRPR